MTDTERLDQLEGFLKAWNGNGIATMPLNSYKLFSIEDLADEDGTNLGEEICLGKSLREVIDNLETSFGTDYRRENMDAIKIEQAKSDYQKIVSFIEDGSPLPPETDPYWESCAALDRLGGFIADIEGAKNTEQQVQKEGADKPLAG